MWRCRVVAVKIGKTEVEHVSHEVKGRDSGCE